jgi:hypothetical protein
MSEYLKEGYIALIPELKGISEYWRITAREPFVYRTNEGQTSEFDATVASGSTSGWKNIVNLEPDDNPRRLYQVRVGVKNGMAYYFKIPTGTNRFGVDEDKDVGYLDNINAHYAAMNELFEFFIIKNFYPSINATNNSSVTQTPKVYFTGMKYDIEPVKDVNEIQKAKNEKKYRYVCIGGVRT